MLQAPVRTILADKGHEVMTVELNDTVVQAVDRLNDRRIGSLVVVDGNRPVGILTERDLLVRVLGAGLDPGTTRVYEVMTKQLISIAPTTTVTEAMRVVTETRCRHLPVMDGGELRGMVSIGDLTRWIVQSQKMHIVDMEQFICRG